jgi:uncharacterized SAM-binding protein YcdF (DUF218 family)
LLLIAVLAFFGTMFRIYLAARSDDMGPAGAIVVLGAAQFNGVPSRVFQARLDTAYELYQAGASELIVVTGGRLPGDVYTEGESGRNYLIERGIPPESILMEHISSNTEESMQRVSVILEERGIDDVLLVSDGFHLYRSRMLAEEYGLRAQINDADDSPIVQGSGTEFRYVVRETFAVLAHRLGLD